MENFGKICWNLWRVKKFGKRCEKSFGKSLKSGKIGQILNNIFYRVKQEMENFGKICWNLWRV